MLCAVELKEGLSLFDALPDLFSRDGILSEEPDTMEEYGQRQVGGMLWQVPMQIPIQHYRHHLKQMQQRADEVLGSVAKEGRRQGAVPCLPHPTATIRANCCPAMRPTAILSGRRQCTLWWARAERAVLHRQLRCAHCLASGYFAGSLVGKMRPSDRSFQMWWKRNVAPCRHRRCGGKPTAPPQHPAARLGPC